jgi:hypothetical protein
MDICVLSSTEAGRLENYGLFPVCKAHRHITKKAAIEGAESGVLRFLMVGLTDDTKKPVSMVTKAGEVSMWQPVPCRNTDGSALMGLRVWGNARSR